MNILKSFPTASEPAGACANLSEDSLTIMRPATDIILILYLNSTVGDLKLEKRKVEYQEGFKSLTNKPLLLTA
jgi:hypothetical protein